VSCRVIGIAADAKYASARERAPRTIYFPLTKITVAPGNLVFLMRSAKLTEAISGYRTALRDVAPNTPLLRFATLQQQMDDSFGPQRLLTLLCNTFGVLALFLSAIGLYGLLASSVARRTAEIGVRIALGAKRSDILKLILNEAMRLLIVGILLGTFALFAAVRLVQGMLYGVSPYDPATLAIAAALLTAVALFAAFVPARRAASVDPMQALRTE
jgi:predicted lysophospholipase L1 biosynthesis ABC-type transport system permease subunit